MPRMGGKEIMEKKIYELKINEKLAALFPPLDTTEYQMLEESIIKEGCTDPLIVWDGTIVDGHNRYQICQEHKIPFSIMEKEFEGENEAIMWMLTRQLGRRNLTSYHKGELALKYEPMFADAAEKRMLAGVKADPEANLPQGSGRAKRTREKVADIAGVSDGSMRKIKALSERGDDETKEKLRRGDISVHKAYTDLMKKEHEGETKVCERCGKEKHIGDFPIHSNKQSFEPVCKACEEEQKREVEAAVAEDTPIGVSGKGGFIFHTGNALPDAPESFSVIQQQLQIAAENFMASLALALQNYTPGMASDENNKWIDSTISSMAREARQMINEHKKEKVSNE